ncbi:uncharacterized protein LOC130736143 [Lotus japonicus]|uniref:uncharacterized protein LOC130736143 n=1 Tax=Lotus japonicus TaxID=34305 RepID=UPI00258C7FB7|nr:uncharacterized protein LOC130736143 [Lotus japonicus]
MGRTTGVFVQRKKKSNRSAKFGFVRFCKAEDAKEAIQALNGLKLNGRHLKVSLARYPFFTRGRGRKSIRGRNGQGRFIIEEVRRQHWVPKPLQKKTKTIQERKYAASECCYILKVESKERLSRTVIATLRELQSIDFVQSFMSGLGWSHCKIASMGVREVLSSSAQRRRCSSS